MSKNTIRTNMKKTSNLRNKNVFTPYIFLSPALILITLFSFIPVLQAFYLSFTEYNMFYPPEWVGLANYQKVFTSEVFRKALTNSLAFWLGTTPFLSIFPIFVAVLVNQKLRGIKLFRTIYYFPVIVTMVITGQIWSWLYQENGIMNYILDVLHIIDKPIHWLTSPKTALVSLMIITIWQGIGYFMVIYLAGLQSIPNELYDAASIDGAGPIRKHLNVTIPLLVPSITVVTVMSTLSAIKAFDLMFIMTKGEGGPAKATTTMVLHIYKTAFQDLDMGYASAMGFVLFIIVLTISLINLKISDSKTVKL